ncbi:winged helix-turn-helix transcriptional regulator [Candidatus Woesearchaeota archaeon]|nr:winged helix-turn-helix transcriptional regulator [Candidatus Woesearchaeota archaeon]
MWGKTIKTEVDSLVSLIQGEEKISIKEAARKLGVPVSTVSEWASFLEEEGIINIEYKFTTPFLVKKKLSDEQIRDLKSKVKEEKDIFDRKSDSTLSYLNKLEEEVESLEELFEDLGNNFKSRLSDAGKELKELRKAEEEKQSLNKEILESKQKFIKQVADVNKQLAKEQSDYNNIYNFLYNQSQVEGQILDIQDDELELIKSTDRLLGKKLKQLRSQINKKKSGLSQKKQDMTEDTEDNLKELEKKYSELKDTLEEEKQVIEELIKENKEQEKQIESLKKDVLSKMKTSNSNLDKTVAEVKEVPKKLKVLMKKKKQVSKILEGISYNERMLKEKLMDLMKKGSALNLADSSTDIMEEFKGLEKDLSEITKKKGFFEKEIKKIFKLLKF